MGLPRNEKSVLKLEPSPKSQSQKNVVPVEIFSIMLEGSPNVVGLVVRVTPPIASSFCTTIVPFRSFVIELTSL